MIDWVHYLNGGVVITVKLWRYFRFCLCIPTHIFVSSFNFYDDNNIIKIILFPIG
jgi:hypothetical protein